MPPQINNVQKRAGTRRTNTIANSIRIFRGLEGLAELPYLSPLKPICSLAISILELVQTLRKLRDDHAELIDRIKQLALILDPGKNKARTIVTEVEDLERALTEIIAVLEAECRLGWFQRVRKSQELKDNILSCTAKLDAYIERFTIKRRFKSSNIVTYTWNGASSRSPMPHFSEGEPSIYHSQSRSLELS
ncbi:hypothetical protein BDN71DRAFT_193062 [Pleurotus eryngii]|uniref:Uncharacterized protein n=1 Tax=Pleurotus eryngii TaxID=5323 RepID=A0A9P5ZRC5_PLEER|nr:hypothetical protein BDN71DRAFT_193062 [Pleurotus eryngii]